MSAQVAGGGSATKSPNPHRGETALVIDGTTRTLRPTFTALVAAEEELGPLFALVERAGSGQLRLTEMVALFWHCIENRDGLTREMVGNAVSERGLAAATKPLRALLAAILQGK
ncbi:hypothetical protein A6F68_00269 [Tsuneonella dongtanensis]|uniref:Phage tail tube protein, GTA-gp10 n=1 Tax=Tsuneonella dongtanensis TaxID=692370 RepID=A0A1B2A9P8_9SPHN|nr:gene transfer agent family protein [Tsuneonella dongtanensis]ANY18804.1 hypothetical protein A6F68_00269 [Tsuneonella dongtanensis]